MRWEKKRGDREREVEIFIQDLFTHFYLDICINKNFYLDICIDNMCVCVFLISLGVTLIIVRIDDELFYLNS
mgnify:CR=1 FL=1